MGRKSGVVTALAAVVLFVLMLTPAVFAAVGDVTLLPATISKSTNSTFAVEVHVDSGALTLGAYQFVITFDNTLINVDTTLAGTTNGLKAGPDGFLTVSNPSNAAGTINVNGLDTTFVGTGPGANLNVLTINFKTLAKAGSAPITINVVALTDPNGVAIGAATPRAGIGNTITVTALAPVIGVAPTNIPFPSTTVGATNNQTVTISNTGTADLSITGIATTDALAAPFSITGGTCGPTFPKTVAPAGNCTVIVTFAPTAVGSPADHFNITSNDAVTPLVTVNVSGTAVAVPKPVIGVAPTTVNFASTAVGATNNQTVTISNTGNANLSVTAIATTNPLAAPFSIAAGGTCGATPITITPGSNCTLRLAFTPTAVGSPTDSFNIGSNDTTTPSVTVTVNGTATPTPVPNIVVAPTTVPFGSVTNGTAANQTVTISNTGNANLSITGIASTDALAAPFSIVAGGTCGAVPVTVTPGSNCTVIVRFAPTAVGAATDSFNISSNDPDTASVTVNVSGTGVAAPAPNIVVAPSTVPFGNVTVGTTATQTVTISNTGNANLSITGIATTDALAAPYSITGGSCGPTFPKTVAPAGNCTVIVTFAPTAVGSPADHFNIVSNDPISPSVTVNVNGSGIPVPAPKITVTDSVAPIDDHSVNFGNLTQNDKWIETVTIANDGNANLSITGIATSNPLAAPFSIVTGGTCGTTFPKTVAPAVSCTVLVQFAPTAIGSFTDSFNIASNDAVSPAVTVNVSGAGVAAGTPPPAPKQLFPADKQTGVNPATIEFKWEKSSVSGGTVSYDLCYGEGTLTFGAAGFTCVAADAVASLKKEKGTMYAGSTTGAGLLLFGVAFAGAIRNRKKMLMILALLLLSGFLLGSCGSRHKSASNTVTKTVSGLKAATTYSWYVNAKDNTNGETTHSETMFTFTTQ